MTPPKLLPRLATVSSHGQRKRLLPSRQPRTNAQHHPQDGGRPRDLHYTYVATNENIADCMTKNNYYPAFKKFRAAMGVA